MSSPKRILVTGARGMVGQAVVRALRAEGEQPISAPPSREVDLCDPAATDRLFDETRPQEVYLIAAKVGGIGANCAQPVEFLDHNCRIAVNTLASCHRLGVRKVLFLGSSCIYPRECPQPMREGSLMQGPLEPTNEGYALGKIVGVRLAQAYRKQYGLNTICPMPCNVYGTGDSFDLEHSHVLSALVKRFVDAQDQGQEEVVLWGTGQARREFIHVQDLAEGLVFLMKHYDGEEIINVGSGVEISIRDLADKIATEVGYRGRIRFDSEKPDGMPRKCMEVSRLRELGFECRISLDEGLRRTLGEYRDLKYGELPSCSVTT